MGQQVRLSPSALSPETQRLKERFDYSVLYSGLTRRTLPALPLAFPGPSRLTLALMMQQCRVWFSCSYSRLNSRDPRVAAGRKTDPDQLRGWWTAGRCRRFRSSLTGIIRVIIIILRFCSGRRGSGGGGVVERRFGSRSTFGCRTAGSGDNRLPFVLYRQRRRPPPPRTCLICSGGCEEKPARHIDLQVPLTGWRLEGAAGGYLRRGPSAGGVWGLTPVSQPSSRPLTKTGPRYGRQLLFLLSVPVVASRETAAAAADEDADEEEAAATLRRQHISATATAALDAPSMLVLFAAALELLSVCVSKHFL